MLYPVCQICEQDLAGTAGTSSLACGHVFHSECVRRRVVSQYDCAVCHSPASLPSINPLVLSLRESPGEKERIVLDLLQTKSEDAERENCELKLEIERLKREISSDTVAFNMKVVELQNKFHRVEEEIIMKNMEIARLKNSKWNTIQSNVTETEILEDTLRPGMFSAIYSSLNMNYSSKPFTKQVQSCLRQSVVICITVAIIILLTVVIPIKISFSSTEDKL